MSGWEMFEDEAEGGRKHSRFAPSSLKRILKCPRSVALAEAMGLTGGKSSVYAAEGSVAHTVAEGYLRQSGSVIPNIGTKVTHEGHDIVIDQDMHMHGSDYAAYVRGLMVPGDVLFVESTVTLDAIVGVAAGMYGHLDAAIWSPSRGRLIIIDYKYGRGIRVIALDNDQLKAYGLGAMHSIPSIDPDDVRTIEAHVFQPRVPGHSAPDIIPAVDLLAWGHDEVAPVIASIQADGAVNAPYVTGDHCRFCPAKAQCPAMRDRALKAAQRAFGAAPLPPTTMSDEEVADALDEVEVVEPWFDAVRGEALARAMHGRQIRDRKVVAGRGRRVWVDEEAVKTAFPTKPIYEPLALKSPAQMEKVITDAEDRQKLKTLWTNKSSGHSLARANDPRPGVRVGTAADVFRNASSPQQEQ